MNTQFKRWTDSEEDELLKEISEEMPIYAISKAHGRSKKAIELRLLDIAIRMRNNGISDSEILKKTGCSNEQINTRIAQIQEEKENKAGKVNGLLSEHSQTPIGILQQSKSVNTINSIFKEIQNLSHQIDNLREIVTDINNRNSI